MAERSLALASATMALRWRIFLPRQLPAMFPNFHKLSVGRSIRESTLDEPDLDHFCCLRIITALCYKGS